MHAGRADAALPVFPLAGGESVERQIYSVSQINEFIKNLLDGVPQLGGVFIRGELSNYKIYPSGHHYFTLKDGQSALRCVMFKSAAMKLRFRAENGMKVIAFGRVSVYPRDGAYQLYCTSLTADGIGDLHVAFEQLKEKLYREGLFDEGHKKPLPRYPRRIAIVTSSAGAAVHDMIRILRRRYPVAKVLLLPVRVQGAEAPPEIAGAIRYANRWQLADVLITGRGGGSLEDLWAFNDERVVRAIYSSQIPVISAVGHEPDVTLSDFAADKRASTPSNGAEIAVPDQQEIRASLLEAQLRLQKDMEKKLRELSAQLQKLSERRVMTSPSGFVDQRREDLDMLSHRWETAFGLLLTSKKKDIGRVSAALDAMSPLKVLGRGFSLVTDDTGALIKNAADVAIGDTVHIKMERGSLDCRVEHRTGEER